MVIEVAVESYRCRYHVAINNMLKDLLIYSRIFIGFSSILGKLSFLRTLDIYTHDLIVRIEVSKIWKLITLVHNNRLKINL